jgi:hypothetical protein
MKTGFERSQHPHETTSKPGFGAIAEISEVPFEIGHGSETAAIPSRIHQDCGEENAVLEDRILKSNCE